jgi:uncharacterized protein with ParB-like and HNH nuclease domain
MIKSALNKPISELLGIDSNWLFTVPKYQREYVWRRDDWENLFDDLWENPPGYFLGSMICINRSTGAMQTQALEVVDGQQRLTTLSLLYAAVYTFLSRFGERDEDSISELYNLRHRLILRGKKRSLRLEPSYQGNNNLDYQAILQEAGILDGIKIPPFAGNRRIFKAYRFFINRLDEQDEKGKRRFDLKNVQELLARVNRASMVTIEVGSHADAFTLFESLNNRGVPLSALDLIKNKLLATLEKKTPESIEDNFNKWKELLDNLADDYTVQERFIRQYYNTFKYRKEISVPNAPLATRSNIIHIYEKLIDKNAKWLFSDLLEKAKLYGKIIAPYSDGVPENLAKQFLNLARIGGAPAYVLILFLLAERSKMNLSGICELLVRYLVRRNLTDVPPTRDLPRIFMDIITKIREGSDKEIEKTIRRELLAKGRIASDDLFKDKLSGNIYLENVDVTRFILCSIEEKNQTLERLTDLWERDKKGDLIWTVEHIFPQGQNIPTHWMKMIADGDEKKAREYRDTHAHNLGNLTITGYNSKLGNKSFEDKRDRKDSNDKYVGYKNGLFLNKELKNAKVWTIENIENRTQVLVEEAMRLFSF